MNRLRNSSAVGPALFTKICSCSLGLQGFIGCPQKYILMFLKNSRAKPKFTLQHTHAYLLSVTENDK